MAGPSGHGPGRNPRVPGVDRGPGTFIEDLVAEGADHGITRYVLLGAGLDTFAQREPENAARLAVFEIDQLGAQARRARCRDRR